MADREGLVDKDGLVDWEDARTGAGGGRQVWSCFKGQVKGVGEVSRAVAVEEGSLAMA